MSDQLPCPLCKANISLADADARGRVICGMCLHEYQLRGSRLTPWVDDDLDVPSFEPPPMAHSTSVSPMPMPPSASASDEPIRPRRRPRPIDFEPPVRRKRSRWIIVSLAFAVILGLIFGGSAVFHTERRPRPEPAFPLIAAADFEIDIEEPVLVPIAPMNDATMRRELQQFFDFLLQDLQIRKGAALLGSFDVHRFIDELAADRLVPRERLAQRQEFIRGFREGIGRGIADQTPLFDSEALQIKSIRRLAGNEADVALDAPKNGSIAHIRCRVTKRSGEWKIYDIENRDIDFRVSRAIASFLKLADRAEAMQLSLRFRGIGQALLSLAAQNIDEADRELNAVGPEPLPAHFDGLRHMIRGCIELHRNNDPEALKAFAEARKVHPSMPKLDYFEAVAHNSLNQPKLALDKLNRYVKTLGDDADVCRELGAAYRLLYRLPEAARQFRKSLDYFPQSDETFFALMQSLGPSDNRDDIGRRFRETFNREASFQKYAQDCLRTRDGRTLEVLCDAMSEIDPNSSDPSYYQAVAQVHQRRPALADVLIKKALARERDPFTRTQLWERFLKAAADGGSTLPAYRMAADKSEAFGILGGQLQNNYAINDLRLLTSLHKKSFPDDPLVPLFEATVFAHEGDYAKADARFRDAAAKNADPQLLARADVHRVRTAYRLGRGVQAFRESADPTAAFNHLAQLAWIERDGEFLEKLCDAQEKLHPAHKLLPETRIRGHLLRGRDEAAATAFLERLNQIRAEDERLNFVDGFWFDCVDVFKGRLAYDTIPAPQRHIERLLHRMLALRQVAESLDVAKIHRKKFPNDPWPDFFEARIEANRNAWPRAAELAASAWKRLPENAKPFHRFDFERILTRAGQEQKAYAESSQKDDAFVSIAHWLIADKKWTELTKLMSVHRPSKKDDPETTMIYAHAKIAAKNPAGAAALLRIAVDNQPDQFRRQEYVAQFIAATSENGSVLDAYRLIDDSSLAFEPAARWLLERKNYDGLATLIDEHAQRAPTDPQIVLFRGELSMARGKYVAAFADFTAGVDAEGPNAFLLKACVERAIVKLKRTVRKYRESVDDSSAFPSLANACRSEKDAEQLKLLIDAHRATDPDDPFLALWEVEAMALTKDHDAVLTRHAEFVKTRPYSPDEYPMTELALRACIHSKKPEVAQRILVQRGIKNRFDTHFHVLAAAASHDPAKVIAAAEKIQPTASILRSYYADPDLGPILRLKSFAPFRQRFPEPPKNITRFEFDGFDDRD